MTRAALLPIYVPTKGRADRLRTLRLLLDDGLAFRAVVEPQDAAAYRAAGVPPERLAVLPDNDQGLAAARNWVLADALSRGLGWFWMLDDDITRFGTVAAGRFTAAAPSVVLAGAQAVFADRPALAQAALEYQQFAWRAKRPWVVNSYCDVAVAIHAQRCRRLRFCADVTLKLDRDFTLQVLAAGYDVVRTTRWAFDCPANGSNPGGLQPLYRQPHHEAAACQRMVARWGPEVCRHVVKPSGRHDVRIDWTRFRRPNP